MSPGRGPVRIEFTVASPWLWVVCTGISDEKPAGAACGADADDDGAGIDTETGGPGATAAAKGGSGDRGLETDNSDVGCDESGSRGQLVRRVGLPRL